MKLPSCFTRALLLALTGAMASGCTQITSTVETALQPQASQTTTQTGAENATSANALAPEPAPSAGPLTNGQPVQEQAVAAIDPAKSVQFLQLEGMPQGAATKLSRSLQTSAQQRGLGVASPTQSSSAYRVRGYFSALNDGSGTLLVYVWDVLDASGKRVHRINGQERSGNTSTNPWLSITDKELGRVADRTADQLKSWVETRKS